MTQKKMKASSPHGKLNMFSILLKRWVDFFFFVMMRVFNQGKEEGWVFVGYGIAEDLTIPLTIHSHSLTLPRWEPFQTCFEILD